jgi:transcriptional regulator with XRE-family HTH domain
MGRRKPVKRTPLQVAADDASAGVSRKLGQMIRDGRTRLRLTQDRAAQIAGIARSEWSNLERGKKVATVPIWSRAAQAVGGKLRAYIEETSAATAPRDAVHLRNQELVLRTSRTGGWRGVPEQALDADLTRSRHGDVVLSRQRAELPEWCLIEVIDWVADAGESVRDFDRRLAALDRHAVARMKPGQDVPRSSGFWLLRATRRNRELVDEHRHFFRGRFPGSGRAWLAALTSEDAPMPSAPALLWVDVKGTRIFVARLGGS